MRKILSLLFLLIVMAGQGQETGYYTKNYPRFRKAMDLFQKEKFVAAQKLFEETEAEVPNPNNEYAVICEYYSALCALHLFNNDAETRLTKFLDQHPDSKWNEQVFFHLGNLNYRKKKYEKTLEFFSQVNPANLSEKEIKAYRFKLGYSYLMQNENDKALSQFQRIKNDPSDYYLPANYYYGHLNYRNGRYQEAYESFMKIKDEKGFSDIVPYYIVQILHHQRKHDELIAYAQPLLENSTPSKSGEISRMIGEAYYNKKEYATALPYLEKFVAEDSKRTLEDNFQLGYCYHQVGNDKKATKYLNYVTSEDSRMGQVALYIIADSYLKKGQKEHAQSAFSKASKMRYDTRIQEDALFNYAKLTYELSYNPYHQAIEAFHQYLEKYPKSSRVEEVNEFLIYVYLTTRNYKAAIESLERIRKKDFRMQSAYQYIAYNRAVELMLAGDKKEALLTFKKVSTHPIDKKLVALSLFWQGELLYGIGKYDRSIQAYNSFLKSDGAYSSGRFNLALYNIGYAYYKGNKIPEAIDAFRKFSLSKSEEEKLYIDADNRTADCYFVSKQYKRAGEFYNKAIKESSNEADYSTFRLGMSYGYMEKQDQKIAVLEKFVNTYTTSTWYEDALFELGDAYFKEGQNQKAIEKYELLAMEFPQSRFTRKAMLQTGLIHYRNQQYEKALSTFKLIVTQFPNFEDSKDAIARVEDIYVELGRIEEYNSWVRSLTFINISDAALDSVNYRAAESVYNSENCDKAIQLFSEYIDRFEKPIFFVNAHFYIGECYFKQDKREESTVHYAAVADAPNNKFTEPALVTVAYLKYKAGELDKALAYYKRLEEIASFKLNLLEAQIGQMRVQYELKNYDEAILYATKVIIKSFTPDDILVEAKLKKANALMAIQELDDAFGAYKDLADNHSSIEAAEARYQMAYIRFSQENYSEAENEVFAMVNAKPIYDDWLAKSFILLANVYIQMDDLFQAKATLESVIENHEGEELVQEAKEKYDQILAMEAKENEGNEQPMELNLGDDNPEYEKLFEETEGENEIENDTIPSTVVTAPVDTLNKVTPAPTDTIPNNKQ